MLIRLGYEIAIECPQPTPLISLLEIHHDRQADISARRRVLDVAVGAKPAPIATCSAMSAGASSRRRARSACSTTRWSRTAASPTRSNTLAGETPVEKLPDECSAICSAAAIARPIIMSGVAWQLFGHCRPGWARVQAICDYRPQPPVVRLRLCARHPHRRRRRYDERVGVCRDFAHLAITLCRCMNIPARYVNGYLGDIGVPADPAPMDFSRLVRGLSRRQMVHVRCAPQRAAHRPRRGRARPRRDRRAAAAQFRPAHADAVQGLDLRAGGRARADAAAAASTGPSSRACCLRRAIRLA